MRTNKQRGRPTLPTEERRDDWHMRASCNELQRWQAAADAASLTLSEWVRGVLDRAAKRAGR